MSKGGGTTAYCLVDSTVSQMMYANGHEYSTGPSGAFSTAMTAALGKGCTAYGGVIGSAAGGILSGTALQGMLCPTSMVGSYGRCKPA